IGPDVLDRERVELQDVREQRFGVGRLALEIDPDSLAGAERGADLGRIGRGPELVTVEDTRLHAARLYPERQPNCTDRRVIAPPNQNPVIGHVATLPAAAPAAAAPAATMTGTKCSWVGSASRTPGARLR